MMYTGKSEGTKPKRTVCRKARMPFEVRRKPAGERGKGEQQHLELKILSGQERHKKGERKLLRYSSPVKDDWRKGDVSGLRKIIPVEDQKQPAVKNESWSWATDRLWETTFSDIGGVKKGTRS